MKVMVAGQIAVGLDVLADGAFSPHQPYILR